MYLKEQVDHIIELMKSDLNEGRVLEFSIFVNANYFILMLIDWHKRKSFRRTITIAMNIYSQCGPSTIQIVNFLWSGYIFEQLRQMAFNWYTGSRSP